jgi:hypothetical protein
MALFKTTWIFQQNSLVTGWSETWYITAVDKPTAHNASIAVALKRIGYMVSECTLVAVRTSANIPPTTAPPNPHRQRDVLITFVNIPGQLSSSFGAAVTWVAGVVRWSNASLEVFRTQLIRGLPGNAYDNDSDKIAASTCQSLIGNMLPTMMPNNFAILHRTPGSSPVVKVPVAVTAGIYERISRRATGRPFYLYRGRKSAR